MTAKILCSTVTPPYLHETRTARNAYTYEMTKQMHSDLLNCLSGIKGKFMLSGYHSDMYDCAASQFGWRCEEREIDNKASRSKAKEKKMECLWMNF